MAITFEIVEWINIFIKHFIMDAITDNASTEVNPC